MNYREFARKQTESVRRTVDKGTAVSALSGGVDSAVTTVRGAKALGRRLARRKWSRSVKAWTASRPRSAITSAFCGWASWSSATQGRIGNPHEVARLQARR